MDENLMEFGGKDENDSPDDAVPSLAQTPVVVNSILKPSNKDNLIQLYTPVHKKLKVHFETPRVGFAPSVEQTPNLISLNSATKTESPVGLDAIRDMDDKENWIERTSVLTKQDHEDYSRYASEIVVDLIANLPIERGSESGENQVVETEAVMNDTQTDAVDLTGDASNSGDLLSDQYMGADVTSSSEPLPKWEQNSDVLTQECVQSNLLVAEKMEVIGPEAKDAVKGPQEGAGDTLLMGKQTSLLTEMCDSGLEEEIIVRPSTDQEPAPKTVTQTSQEGPITVELKEDSSDEEEEEEFLSADEEVQDNPQAQSENPDPKSPPLPATKGTYNFNLDDLDTMNPFETKSKVVLSPCKSGAVQVSEKVLDIEKEKDNPDRTPEKQYKHFSEITSPGEKDLHDLMKSEPAGLLEENYEEINPFETRTQLVNSPDVKVGPSDQEKLNNEDLDVADPFKARTQLFNSPEKANSLEEPKNKMQIDTVQSADVTNSLLGRSDNAGPSPLESIQFDDIDLFKGSPALSASSREKTQKTESDAVNFDDINPFQPKQQLRNSPINSEQAHTVPEPYENVTIPEPDSLQVGEGDGNSKSNFDIIDPFKPTKAVENSPQKAGLDANLNVIDPFKAGKTLNNSLQKSESIELDFDAIDPFKPKKAVQNSPAQKDVTSQMDFDNIDPFKPRTALGNSPQKPSSSEIDFDSIDPFKPRQALGNSPGSINSMEYVDSFKSKKTLENSPMKEDLPVCQEMDSDPFKPRQAICNSPMSSDPNSNSIEDADPFQSRNTLENTPVKKDLPFSDIDPFEPKKQLSNSPVTVHKTDSVEKVDPFQEIDNPFQPNKQMMNSPQPTSAEDHPFVSRNKLAKSPAGVGNSAPGTAEDNPFVSRNKLANSPVGADNSAPGTAENPFLSRNKLDSSPAGAGNSAPFLAEDNPFTSRNKLANSPAGAGNSATGTAEEEDPFKTKTQIPNSPPQATASKRQSCVLKVEMLEDSEADEANDSTDTIVEVQTVAKRSESGAPNLQDFVSGGDEFDDAQFVPASEVFYDQAAWDMLEQFGSSNSAESENALSRMSLYVKFDPLVDDGGISNPRRISIHAKQLEKVREFGIEESFLLLGTPPKKRRKSVLSSVRGLTPDGTPTNKPAVAKSAMDTVVKSSSSAAKVDQIFALSPQESHSGASVTDKCPCPDLDDDGDDGIVQVLKYTETDVKKMNQELMLEFQGRLLTKEREWSERLLAKEKEFSKIISQKEKQMTQALSSKDAELQARQQKVDKTISDLQQMMVIVKEYEIVITSLTAENEKNNSKSQENIEDLKKQRDQAVEDAQSVERSFSELYKRYDKIKAALECAAKKISGKIKESNSKSLNEEVLKKRLQENISDQGKYEEKVITMKKEAQEKLAKAHQEIASLKAAKESEVTKLEAIIKMKEMHIDRVEKSLESKQKENTELQDICDQLISSMPGGKSEKT